MADDFAGDVEIEVEAETDDETATEEISEETTTVAAETTVENTATKTVEVIGVFETEVQQNITVLDENSKNVKIATIAIDNPSDINYSVALTGTDSEKFNYNIESNELIFVDGADYENKKNYDINIIFTKDNEEQEEIIIPISFAINDINEAPNTTFSQEQTEFEENIKTGTIIATIATTDPEADEVNYSLSGEDADKFAVDGEGKVTVIGTLDFETKDTYEVDLNTSDGTNVDKKRINISVLDVNEMPNLTVTMFSNSVPESSAVGTTVGVTSAFDPEGVDTVLSLSGEDASKFTIDNDGNIKIAEILDYENKDNYRITIVSTAGDEVTEKTISVNVSDVDEVPTIASQNTANSFAETSSVGTTVINVTGTDPESGTISYSLSGSDSSKFTIDASGNVKISSTLDYEANPTYDFAVNVSDGTHTTTQDVSVTVTNINEAPVASTSMAASSFAENISVGTTIATINATDPESDNISYSLSGTGSNKFSIASNGVITSAGALDYETTTSYNLTVTVSDGNSSSTQNITITVADLSLSSLSTTLAASKFSESSSSGTAIASVASISNPDSETVTYTLSGTGSDKFTVNSSSGAITTASALDFEEAKSYNLTLTGTGSDNNVTTTSAVNVAVQNVEELQSNTLRYSAAVSNVSRTGFSATGTRGGGPSGTNLGAYQQEQIITTSQSTATNKTLADFDNIGSDNVHTPVSIVSGDGYESVAVDNLDFRYFYPLGVTSGAGQYQFSPGQQALDGHYKTVDAQSEVVSNISQSEVLSAGRFDSKLFWMTLDKDAETINYNAQQGTELPTTIKVLRYGYYSGMGVNDFNTFTSNTGVNFQITDNIIFNGDNYIAPNLSDYHIIMNYKIHSQRKANENVIHKNAFESWMKEPDSLLFLNIHGERCCGGQQGNSSTATGSTNSFLSTIDAKISVTGPQDMDLVSSNQGGIVDAGTFSSDSRYFGLNGLIYDPSGMGPRLESVTNLAGTQNIGQMLFNKARDNAANLYAAVFIPAEEFESGVNADFFSHADVNAVFSTSSWGNYSDNETIAQWVLNQMGNTNTYVGKAYHTYLDQVVLTGDVYTDAMYNSFTSNNKRIIALNVMPIENHLGVGTSADFFYPSFFSSGFYSSSSMDFKTLAPDYCAAVGNNSSACNTYANHYDWAEQVLDPSQNIDTARFGATSEMPEGTSQWYQVMNPAGKGVGLQAQLSIQDSYDGAGGSTTRDDQQSYLGVMINTMDKRSNDTTKYSAGDTGQYIDGTHYWSYQKRTNQTNDGLGVQLGVSPIECASSSDRGCLIAEDSASDDRPIGMMVTTSDPYKNGPMSVGVKYNTNSDTWNTDTFNQMAISGEFRTTNSASLINSNLPYTGHWAEFDGNNDWFQSNSAVQPLYKSGEPWAFGGVVRVNSTPSEGTFFGRSTGWNSGNSNGGIHLGVTADDKLIFQYGNAYNRLQFTGSDTLSTGTDYGFYVDYDGGTTGVSSGSTAQYFSRFRIKQVNLTTGAVSDVSGSWTAPNYGISSNGDGGQMFVGAKRAEQFDFHGRVYTFTATTLMDNETPDDTEISTFIRNPVQWVTDYKIGEPYRDYDTTTTHNNFQLNDSESSKSTAVFLMYSGDDIQEHDDGLAFNATYQQAINYVGSSNNLGNYTNSNINNVQEGTDVVDANQDYKSISDFRHSDFYTSTATAYAGFFSGLMEFDVSGTGNDQLASVRSGSTLASINFDTTNDEVAVSAPLNVSKLPSNNYTNTWDTVDEGELVLNFGDTAGGDGNSAYISNEVFAAEINNGGEQIDSSSGGASNMAGVMVSYNTLDKEDSDLFHNNGNDPMPDAEYATWGFWALGAVDVSPNSGTKTAGVHLGTWVAGELVDPSEIPTSGSASMSGAAVMKAAYRYAQNGSNYDVHKYTTTADVAASFVWGSNSYSGNIAVTNFDDKNPIVSNAGFTSFNVNLSSNNANTYTGTSSTVIQNGWSGGAAVNGALYGGSTVDESGGRINVSLYKNGSLNQSGANDFYVAEGIYLVD